MSEPPSTTSPLSPKPSSSLLTTADFSWDQAVTVLEIQRLMKMCYWAKPGSGKTAVTLTAVDQMWCHKVLIVGTKRIIQLVWRQEAKLWEHLKDCTFELITGSPAQRIKKVMNSPAQYHLINYELLPWLVDATKETGFPYDAIIFDEVSKMKTPGAERFKKMRQVIGDVPIRIGLTGTPRGNSTLGIWGQMFMTAGPVLAPTMSDYKARWFHAVDDKRLIWRPNAGAEKVIKEKVTPYVHVAPDHAATKDAKINPVMVDLPPSARALYDEMEQEYMITINGNLLIAPSEALLRGKLLQFSSGAVYEKDGIHWVHIHDAKLDAMDELLEEANEDQVLVFYRYKHELERIKARFGKRVTTDIEAWLKGRGELLVIHPQSGGHGLSLHVNGCRTQIWFSLPDSWELFDQGNHRLARRGQLNDVVAHVLAVPGGAEEKLVRDLAGHGRAEKTMMQEVRDGKLQE